MKSFAFVAVLLAVFYQNANAQCLPYGLSSGYSPVISAPAVIQTNTVGNTLADTLSLLTVSSLLSETLPMTPNVIATMPAFAPACAPTIPAITSAISPVIGGCGCGCGYGYNGINSYYL